MTTRTQRWGVVMAAIAILLLSAAATGSALSVLTLSTRFPGITVKPGEDLSLQLRIANDGDSGTVTVDITDFPEGWERPGIRGGGLAVSQVFVGSGESESVTLDVKVPDGASEGTYQVTLTASKDGLTSTLPVGLKVARTAASRASLSTDYPSIQAKAGTSYTFRVTLRNDSDVKQMFALLADQPRGWEVTFTPAAESKQVGTIPVDAGATQIINVAIQVPEQVTEGTYQVPITATSGLLTADVELELEVMGKYDLLLTTPTGRLSAEATVGRENPLTLKVENTGTAALEGITLSASTPPDWTVTFETDQIQTLAPGETKTVTAQVKPSSKAIAGDYLLTLSARSTQYSASDRAEFRVAVKTPTIWGMTGMAALAAVAGGLWWVFGTYGRR